LADKEKIEDEYTLPLNWELRNKIYSEAELHWCSDSGSYDEFLDCLIRKRETMIDAIDEEDV